MQDEKYIKQNACKMNLTEVMYTSLSPHVITNQFYVDSDIHNIYSGNTVLGSAAVTSSMSSNFDAVTISSTISSINAGNLGYPSSTGSNNNNVALRNILRKTIVDPGDVTAALARASLDAAAATAALALSLDAIENNQKKNSKLGKNTMVINTTTEPIVNGDGTLLSSPMMLNQPSMLLLVLCPPSPRLLRLLSNNKIQIY